MQVRWTSAAANDLEAIAEYLFEKSPQSAPLIIRKIYEAPLVLRNYLNLGRVGKKEGTRELVIAPLPYIVVYQIRGDNLFIARILHGAQEWPL